MEKEKMVKLTLKQKILAIRKAMPYFQKDTEGFKYFYVSGCAVLEKFREIADKLGVLMIPKIVGKKLTETKIVDDKNVERMGRIIELDMVFIFMDTESDEMLEVPFAAYGEQRDCSKAFGSALTYAERYFLLKFFTVPTDKDDPDTKGGGVREKEGEKVESGESDREEEGDSNKSIALGNRLSGSHFISQEERELWEKKRYVAANRTKGIDYMIEKIRIGEQLEKSFYIKIMAGNKEISREDAKVEAKEKIVGEFTPLSINEAKEKFSEELK